MLEPKTESKDRQHDLETEPSRAPASASDAEIERKMEELGYLDYGLDI